MTNIKISNSVVPSNVDTPLDSRSRVLSESDILLIDNPFVGQLVYCISNGKFYVVTSLKEKTVGAVVVQNASVNTYIELATGGSGGITEDQKNEILNELKSHLNEAILNGEW